MTEEQMPRINYSAGRKVQDGEYGSFSFQVSISMDYYPLRTKVQDQISTLITQVEKVLTAKVAQVEERTLPYDNRKEQYGNDDYDPLLEGD